MEDTFSKKDLIECIDIMIGTYNKEHKETQEALRKIYIQGNIDACRIIKGLLKGEA